ncbi:hypothetical protein C8Q74DRAFT_1215806 [Fomes fomentarius]|nr:hypothetical protein C8Q74DRAFT_1215806 [Fomes fomentarius]
MSSNFTDTDVADFVTSYAKLDLGNYCSVAASMLLIYDTLLTFSHETRQVVKLYDCCKYLTLCCPLLKMLTQSCTYMERVELVLTCLRYIPPAVFSTLRAFVLSRNKTLSICVLTLGLIPVGPNLGTVLVPNHGETFANLGCVMDLEMSPGTALKISVIVSDAILILITWMSPMTQGLRINIHKDKRQSLGAILVQNGTIYFIVLLCLNVLHLAFSLANIFGIGYVESDIIVFTTPITTILISHFLLDLQEAYQQTVRVDSDDALNLGSNSSTPSFVDRMIGSIGSDIHFATPERPGEDDHPTCTDAEDAQGDREDIQPIHSDSEGHLGDEEATHIGIIGLSSPVINIGRPECRQEEDGLADAAWEDSEVILEVPRTPVVHGYLFYMQRMLLAILQRQPAAKTSGLKLSSSVAIPNLLHERAPETPRGRSLGARCSHQNELRLAVREERRFEERECGLEEEGTGEQEDGLGAYDDEGDERYHAPGEYGKECDLVKKARRRRMITDVRSHLRRAKRMERTMLGSLARAARERVPVMLGEWHVRVIEKMLLQIGQPRERGECLPPSVRLHAAISREKTVLGYESSL